MSLLQQAQAAVENNLVTVDMTDLTTGGGERRVLPTGTAIVQFSGYVDLGTQQPDPYKGTPKKPVQQARLTFHIIGGAGINAEGKRETFVQDGQFPRIDTGKFNLDIKTNEKANAVAIFNAMNYSNDPNVKHFVSLLGSVFLLPITSEAKDGKTYNRFDFRKLQMPVINPVEGTLAVAGKDGIPTVSDDQYQLLLWDAPTKEQWDSIYIDGEYPAKDGKPAQSKNFIQETVMTALNFAGSPIEQLIIGAGVTLPSLTSKASTEVDTTNDLPDVPEA